MSLIFINLLRRRKKFPTAQNVILGTTGLTRSVCSQSYPQTLCAPKNPFAPTFASTFANGSKVQGKEEAGHSKTRAFGASNMMFCLPHPKVVFGPHTADARA